MTIRLRCGVTADLLLLNDLGNKLLGLLGKVAQQPGIIEPEDMPRALAMLNALSDEVSSAMVDERESVPFVEEPVSLRKRAWPLIKMIEEAQAAGKPIVWGV
jgi:Domain of unknown function (DUF1840)